MPYEFYNPNPASQYRGDCAIRALCKALDRPWEYIYVELCAQGFEMSYAPKRDSMGRYSRDGFMDKLIELKASAPDEKHRAVVDRMMAELEH